MKSCKIYYRKKNGVSLSPIKFGSWCFFLGGVW